MKWYRPSEYYAGSRWRGTWALDGGGALMNQGIHTMDLLLWLVGDPTRIYARTRTALRIVSRNAAMETAGKLVEDEDLVDLGLDVLGDAVEDVAQGGFGHYSLFFSSPGST